MIKFKVLKSDEILKDKIFIVEKINEMLYKDISTGLTFIDTWDELDTIAAYKESHFYDLHIFTDIDNKLRFIEEIKVIKK